MTDKALKTLEYDKIRQLLAAKTACVTGTENALALKPKNTLDAAMRELSLTAEAESFLIRFKQSPVTSFPDMRECLKRLSGILFLTAGELLNLKQCLRAARVARELLLHEPEASPMLTNMAGLLSAYKHVEEEIDRCIVSEDEISDQASVALGKIRRGMRQANERAREKLNSIIKSATYSKYLQEPIITIRNGRFVLPVKQECRQYLTGLIHDQSGSGATLFIEPTSVVELGNEYKKLCAEEAAEIQRILTELTAMLAPYADNILENINLMGDIDLIFAKALLAQDMRAIHPALNAEGEIRIMQGRHPLIQPDRVVPIDIWLGDAFRTLVITGPNTGGKTVTLKTVGLLTLMAQSGMFIPADERSAISVFDDVFVDIGDEQSIEQSLSTFSSHMTNIVSILQNADADSLVLLDELGAGTDPVEGASLAMSILEEIHSRRSVCIATTHYSEIKAFAMLHEGMENASMEFDIDKLAPTYKLFIGIPGKSNAFEISERLGLSKNIIDSAKTLIKREHMQFEDVISNAEAQLQIANRERALAEAKRRELDRLHDAAELEKKRFEEDRAKYKQKARDEARSIVTQAKQEAERIIGELRDIPHIQDKSALDRTIQKSRDELRELSNSLSAPVTMEEDSSAPPEQVRIGDTVKIVSLGKNATVLVPADAKGDVQVQAGIIKLSVKLDDLRLVQGAAASGKGNVKQPSMAPRFVNYELDIRGMLVDDAIPVVDRHMEDAKMAGLTEVNIIHGKGTGALRSGIQAFLKGHPGVKSFRMGNYGEGDAGVTVVTLK